MKAFTLDGIEDKWTWLSFESVVKVGVVLSFNSAPL
jgi:hypothetical protein